MLQYRTDKISFNVKCIANSSSVKCTGYTIFTEKVI